MTIDTRPDPNKFLAIIADEEEKKGKLKIFLGYAAGVGKTYSMLKAAHEQKEHGVDIVAGYIEPHGRRDTEKLQSGIEIVPQKEIAYKNLKLYEPDIESIIERRPDIVLIDELAHTNSTGSTNQKRFQDIEELLTSGINVYTTVNIQHFESLKDLIFQITGIEMQERVPDSFIDAADEIELIDIPPEELLVRLKEGKIYIPEKAKLAVSRFFKLENLIALREIAMRRTADHIKEKIEGYNKKHGITDSRGCGDKIAVSISPSPFSAMLIRAAKQLASKTNSDLAAVYVENEAMLSLSEEAQKRLSDHIRLAQSLGATVEKITGNNVAETLVDFCKKRCVTRIIIGKPVLPSWKNFFRRSVADEIIHLSGTIDVYMVSHAGINEKVIKQNSPGRKVSPANLFYATLITAAITLFSLFFKGMIEPTNLAMFYLMGVVFSSLYFGFIPAAVTTVTSVLTFDFIFVPPYWTFAVQDTQYLLTFAGFFIVAMVISSLVSRAKQQFEVLSEREKRTAILYALAKDFAAAHTTSDIIQKALFYTSAVFPYEFVVFIPHFGREVFINREKQQLAENDRAIAQWVFKNAKPAGHGTETLSGSAYHFFPMIASKGIIGAIGMKAFSKSHSFSLEEKMFLETLGAQIAIALERTLLSESIQEHKIKAENEKLKNNLLSTIAHDIRTPIAALLASASALVEKTGDKDEIAQIVYDEAERLNRLVANVLNITKIESGRIELKKEPYPVEDLISSALGRVKKALGKRHVLIETPKEILVVAIDPILAEQVLINLFENALKYSPEGSPVEIVVKKYDDDAAISVKDHGTPIPVEEKGSIFEKFYRLEKDKKVAGSGIGLAICRAIVTLHGGMIWLEENNSGAGNIFTFTLPLDKTVPEITGELENEHAKF